MFLDITISESTLFAWGIILVIVIIYFLSDRLRKFKKEYEGKVITDKERYAKSESDLQLKEQALLTKYAEDKAGIDKTIAETKQKATEWGMIEFEKFKQVELQNQIKIITENAINAAKNVLNQWIAENEERIRKDAANRSVRNVLGKVTEHLIPFSEAMKHFNPKDIRFIGSPIDLVIFSGAEELRDDISIHFVEVKTGTSALSKRQQLIKAAIEQGRIFWLRVNMKDFGDDVNEALKEQN